MLDQGTGLEGTIQGEVVEPERDLDLPDGQTVGIRLPVRRFVRAL